MNTKVAIALLVISATPSFAQQCDSLAAMSRIDALAYLRHGPDWASHAACATAAIAKIGEYRYESGIPLLINFLDFKGSSNLHQKLRREVVEHNGLSGYPAADALVRVGRPALPALLDLIKANGTLREEVDIATAVWMTIYKDEAPPGSLF